MVVFTPHSPHPTPHSPHSTPTPHSPHSTPTPYPSRSTPTPLPNYTTPPHTATHCNVCTCPFSSYWAGTRTLAWMGQLLHCFLSPHLSSSPSMSVSVLTPPSLTDEDFKRNRYRGFGSDQLSGANRGGEGEEPWGGHNRFEGSTGFGSDDYFGRSKRSESALLELPDVHHLSVCLCCC